MHFASSGFQALVDAHYEGLFRYAYRLSGSSADAEDLTQEAFSKAMSRLSQLREPERAKAWLFRILRNLYLHKVRNEKRHRIVPIDSIGDLPARDSAEGPPLIDPAKLQEALNELEEGFRTPLILFYFDEFSYRDIADQMELPIGTVMSRLARAKSYLRAKLSSGLNDSSPEETNKVSDAKDAKNAKNAKEVKEVSDVVP